MSQIEIKITADVTDNADGSRTIKFNPPESITLPAPAVIPPVVVPPVTPGPVVTPPSSGPVKVNTSLFKLGAGFPTGSVIKLKSGDYMPQNPNKSYSLQKVLNFLNSEVLRVEVRPGEVWKGSDGKSGDLNNSNRERSEVYRKSSNFRRDIPVWVSFALLIPDEDKMKPLENNGFLYTGQFHAAEDKGDISSAPPVGLQLSVKDGKYFITVISASATERIHTVKPKVMVRGIFEVEKGRWVRIVLKVVFNPNKGVLQVWKDGKNVVSIDTEGIGFNDENGPYWKFGGYRQPVNEPFVCYYANMEVSDAASLWPRVENPLEIS